MALILIAEDDELSQEIVTTFLRRGGHKTLLARDGKSAVEQAQSNLPDLVLMDLNLPEMDGWEATRQIRSTPATSHIPVIALTATAEGEDVARARAAGCDAYALKPIGFLQLMRTVSRHLPAERRTAS